MKYCSKKIYIYSWLDWIFSDLHNFNFVEKEKTREYSKLTNITIKTLLKYAEQLTIKVEGRIKKLLPYKFALIIDGWSKNSVHYLAIFAIFKFKDTSKKRLLTISPLLDAEHLDAIEQSLFIKTILELYDKDTHKIIFMTGDNCPTNRLLARLLHMNFIGCASHRFNLAVTKIIDEYETLITKIHILMTKLLTLKNSAKLRKQTKLRPLTKNRTRLSSIYSMVQGYNERKSYIDNKDASYALYIHSA